MDYYLTSVRNLLAAGHLDLACESINCLSDAERLTLRTQLEAEGLPTPRNLYFNYQTQTWID